MSIEALKAELKANFPVALTVKAADSHHFKSNRVYTSVPTTSHHGGHGHHGKKHNNRDRKNSHHNPVKEAIDNAKNTLDEVRSGGKGNRSKHNSRNRNRRSTSNDTELNQLRSEVSELKEGLASVNKRVAELEKLVQQLTGAKITPAPAAAKAAPAPAKEEAKDDDFDLFGSDDEEESAEAKRVREERLAAYAEKKSKKPGPIAKSSVILDVKPWDDETDLVEMEKLVRSIVQDGLVWGASKLIPVGYGIKKLQIVSTVEDEKVSVEDLQEKITGDFENHVQSVDVVAFNKI